MREIKIRSVNRTRIGFFFLSELRIVKRAVEAALTHELIVVTRLGDLAVLQNENGVRILNGGESVGDDEAGAGFHQLVQRLLDLDLRTGVDVGCRFVQNQHG